MDQYFDVNDNQHQYHIDYAHSTFTCVHHQLMRENNGVPIIVQEDLCFILHLILSTLLFNHPEKCKLNTSEIGYESEPEFCAHCDELILQSLEFHKLFFIFGILIRLLLIYLLILQIYLMDSAFCTL